LRHSFGSEAASQSEDQKAAAVLPHPKLARDEHCDRTSTIFLPIVAG
jgi:hypothetical protein